MRSRFATGTVGERLARRLDRQPSDRERSDAVLTKSITAVHAASRVLPPRRGLGDRRPSARRAGRRRSADGASAAPTGYRSHSSRRSRLDRQYTNWAFGQRLRDAGLLGSIGSIGDCFDNGLAESFFATLQTELLDRHTWATREQLANAVFAYLEDSHNPRRRHSALGYLSPADHGTDWHRQQHKTAA